MKILIVISAVIGVLSAVPYGSKHGGGGGVIVEPIGHGGGGFGSSGSAANAGASSLTSGKLKFYLRKIKKNNQKLSKVCLCAELF